MPASASTATGSFDISVTNFSPRQHYAITGPNGSGKSTLLQVIAGAIAISEGEVRYASGSSADIPPDQAYRYLSFSAPYLDLVEEMTAMEFLNFHPPLSLFCPLLAFPRYLKLSDWSIQNKSKFDSFLRA